jgi:glycosyltransferase involved in cell wall biosynthesis
VSLAPAPLRIGFVYLAGRLPRTLLAESTPSESFLGARELSARGHDVKMLEVGEVTHPSLVTKLLTASVSNAILPAKTYIGLYESVHSLLSSLEDRQVVVATTSGLAFSVAFWRWRRSLPFEVVGIQCGITHYVIGRTSRLVSRFLFHRMHTQLFSDAELSWMSTFFDIPGDRIEPNPFGVDLSFWIPGARPGEPRDETEEPYVLAVGNDSRRDYDTLVEAARGAAWRLTIVTQRPLPPVIPDNVTVIRGSYAEGVSDAELRDLYRNASCVVVPLKSGLQPSGQSVTLQAMACGTPVVLTRTPGLFDAERLRDGEQLLLVEPGDPSVLRAAIERLLADAGLRVRQTEAGLAYVRRHGRIEEFADRLERLCERVAALRGSPCTPTRWKPRS